MNVSTCSMLSSLNPAVNQPVGRDSLCFQRERERWDQARNIFGSCFPVQLRDATDFLASDNRERISTRLPRGFLAEVREGPGREESVMSTPLNVGRNLASEVKSRAGWGIFLGVVTAALGLLLIAYPLATATITTIFIGSILVVAGLVDIFLALRAHTVGQFFLRLLLGVVYGIGGLLLLFNPLWGVAVLTVVLGVMLLFEAGVALVLAFDMRPASGWGWLLFDAVITAILGLLILARWPSSAIWAIGTLVGVAVLMRGITRIALSAGLRRVAGRVEERDIQRPRAA